MSEKSEEKVHMGLYVPKSLKARIEVIAALQGRSLNNTALQLINHALMTIDDKGQS